MSEMGIMRMATRGRGWGEGSRGCCRKGCDAGHHFDGGLGCLQR